MKIMLRNNYHNTAINLVVGANGKLSQHQIKRAKRALCWADCQCSGPLGVRGPQEVLIMEHDESTYDYGYRMGYSIERR